MCNYNQIKKAFKGNKVYFDLTVKNRITVNAAAPIATTGSQKVEKKGSVGKSPRVNG